MAKSFKMLSFSILEGISALDNMAISKLQLSFLLDILTNVLVIKINLSPFL